MTNKSRAVWNPNFRCWVPAPKFPITAIGKAWLYVFCREINRRNGKR